MIMMGDKKALAAGIVSKLKEGPKPVEAQDSKPASFPEGDEVETKDGIEQDDSIGMDAAAEELIAAIEAKSAKGIVEAIKSMLDMYESSED